MWIQTCIAHQPFVWVLHNTHIMHCKSTFIYKSTWVSITVMERKVFHSLGLPWCFVNIFLTVRYVSPIQICILLVLTLSSNDLMWFVYDRTFKPPCASVGLLRPFRALKYRERERERDKKKKLNCTVSECQMSKKSFWQQQMLKERLVQSVKWCVAKK